MTYDEMMQSWRAQDETPLYGVSPDLLRVLVRQEQSVMRRELGWELMSLSLAVWAATIAMLAVVCAVFYAAVAMAVRGRSLGGFTPMLWDYAAMGVGVATILGLASAAWVSHRSQAARERGFGNSLQEEIRRNLSRVDHQLSQGRWGPLAPGVAAIMLLWVFVRVNDNAANWLSFGWIVFCLAWSVGSFGWTRRWAARRSLPYRRRLCELLDLLNASE